MKKLLFTSFLLLTITTGFSQYVMQTLNVVQYFGPPIIDTTYSTFKKGELRTRPQDSLPYRWNGSITGRKWDLLRFGAISLSASNSVIGNLPVTNLNGGSGASGSTFWCGNGTWATPSSSTTLYSGNGTIAGPRTVLSGGNTITFTGADNSDTIVSIINTGTSSIGLHASGSLFGIDVSSSNLGLRVFGTATGLTAIGSTNEGAVITSSTIRGAKVISAPSSTNTTQEVLRLERASTGTPANNIGGSLDLVVEDASNTSNIANQIVWKWIDAANATRTSQFSITGVNSGSTGTLFTLDADGTYTTTGKRIISTVVSAAGTLTLGNAQGYSFSGSTATWTLPVVSGNTGVIYRIKNRGSGNLTINSNAGGNDIYETAAVNTITVAANAAIVLRNDGTYWLVE